MDIYELVVIGSGSGGARAALLAAKRGARVLLVEKDLVGGTCLHHGCVPLSLLARNARRWRDVDAQQLGSTERPTALLAAWVSQIRRSVARQSSQLFDSLRAAGVTLLGGTGRLIGPYEVEIDIGRQDTRVVRAERIILAAGARAVLPEAPGRSLADAAELLHSCEEPREIAIVGGGHIGCEFAGIYNALGSHVSIYERGPRLLPELDVEAGDHLAATFRARGIVVRTGVQIEEISGPVASAGRVPISSLQAERVLWATGRVPNLRELGLERAGVKTTWHVVVDEFLRTSVPHIFAIGDLTGLDGLTAGARQQAQVAVENAFGGDVRFDPERVPRCYWTQPAIATVGWQENRANTSGREIRIGCARPASETALGRADGSRPVELVKLIADAQTRQLLGGMIIGEHAADLVNVLAVGLHLDGKVDDFLTALATPILTDAVETCLEKMFA